MAIHTSTRRSDRPQVVSCQAWALESAPAIGCPPAVAATPARAVTGSWDAATVLALLCVLLCSIAVVAVVQRLDRMLGAGTQRLQVCNHFDYPAATARCTASDPFIVVHHRTTSAALQIDVSGDASRSGVPVTIAVTESNGAGLVTATGTTRKVLHPDGAGVAVLSLQGVFGACHIMLPATPLGSPSWERATYELQVRDRTNILAATIFHIAL
jgi:hypothetical protein